MALLLSLLVGLLFGGGVYLMMRRTVLRILLGLSMIGNATNLLIFIASGLTRTRPPLVREGTTMPKGAYADPVPQALILTAIVISFGVLAFTLALAYRTYRELGTISVAELGSEDE